MARTDDRDVLDEMLEYYRARADEYDEWFERRGRYDRGGDHRARWDADVARVGEWFDSLAVGGDVLELAGGTGWWTERLAQVAATLTVVDASRETLARNRLRVGRADVRHLVCDLFEWQPDDRYDVVFFSFWMSHVPASRFERFWAMVGDALRPGGRAVFIDSLASPTSGVARDRADAEELDRTLRILNDGSEYEIVKVFYELGDLRDRLSRLGWSSDIGRTDEFFFYGVAGSPEVPERHDMDGRLHR